MTGLSFGRLARWKTDESIDLLAALVMPGVGKRLTMHLMTPLDQPGLLYQKLTFSK